MTPDSCTLLISLPVKLITSVVANLFSDKISNYQVNIITREAWIHLTGPVIVLMIMVASSIPTYTTKWKLRSLLMFLGSTSCY
jgi:hypothetical protein